MTDLRVPSKQRHDADDANSRVVVLSLRLISIVACSVDHDVAEEDNSGRRCEWS